MWSLWNSFPMAARSGARVSGLRSGRVVAGVEAPRHDPVGDDPDPGGAEAGAEALAALGEDLRLAAHLDRTHPPGVGGDQVVDHERHRGLARALRNFLVRARSWPPMAITP